MTAGPAGNAMVLNGLGLLNPPRSRVPHLFQTKPRARLMAPGIPASPLTDDPRGRALDTLSAVGVTERYSLMAATAATRWGRTPTVTPLDTTRVQGLAALTALQSPPHRSCPCPKARVGSLALPSTQ